LTAAFKKDDSCLDVNVWSRHELLPQLQCTKVLLSLIWSFATQRWFQIDFVNSISAFYFSTWDDAT